MRLPRIERPPKKTELAAILQLQTDPAAKRAQEQLEQLTEQEIQTIIAHAVEQATDPDMVDQLHLGGNFVTETGGSRGRRLVSLSVPDLAERYPFLYFICVKIVPNNPAGEHESIVLNQLQTAADALPPNLTLPIPRTLSTKYIQGKKNIAVVMERLPRDTRNASLQTLLGNARRDQVVLRLSDDVSVDVRHAFERLHEAGFLHRDINEGNVYLRNVVFEDVFLPKKAGLRRPKIRFIKSADIVVLDFERTFAMPKSQPKINADESRAEDRLVEAMVEPISLPVDNTANLEELVEANDEHFRTNA